MILFLVRSLLRTMFTTQYCLPSSNVRRHRREKNCQNDDCNSIFCTEIFYMKAGVMVFTDRPCWQWCRCWISAFLVRRSHVQPKWHQSRVHSTRTELEFANCSAHTAALQPINFETLTRVTNNASCNWVNLVQVSSVQFSSATVNTA